MRPTAAPTNMLQQNNNNNYPCLGVTASPTEVPHKCSRGPLPFPSRLELGLGELPLVKGLQGLRAWALFTKNRHRPAAASGGVQGQGQFSSSGRTAAPCARPADVYPAAKWGRLGYGGVAMEVPLDARQAGLGALVTVATLKASEGGGQTQTRCLVLRTEGGTCLYSTAQNRACSLGMGPGMASQKTPTMVSGWLRGKVSTGDTGRRESGPAQSALRSNRVRVRSGRRWRKSSKPAVPVPAPVLVPVSAQEKVGQSNSSQRTSKEEEDEDERSSSKTLVGKQEASNGQNNRQSESKHNLLYARREGCTQERGGGAARGNPACHSHALSKTMGKDERRVEGQAEVEEGVGGGVCGVPNELRDGEMEIMQREEDQREDGVCFGTSRSCTAVQRNDPENPSSSEAHEEKVKDRVEPNGALLPQTPCNNEMYPDNQEDVQLSMVQIGEGNITSVAVVKHVEDYDDTKKLCDMQSEHVNTSGEDSNRLWNEPHTHVGNRDIGVIARRTEDFNSTERTENNCFANCIKQQTESERDSERIERAGAEGDARGPVSDRDTGAQAPNQIEPRSLPCSCSSPRLSLEHTESPSPLDGSTCIVEGKTSRDQSQNSRVGEHNNNNSSTKHLEGIQQEEKPDSVRVAAEEKLFNSADDEEDGCGDTNPLTDFSEEDQSSVDKCQLKSLEGIALDMVVSVEKGKSEAGKSCLEEEDTIKSQLDEPVGELCKAFTQQLLSESGGPYKLPREILCEVREVREIREVNDRQVEERVPLYRETERKNGWRETANIRQKDEEENVEQEKEGEELKDENTRVEELMEFEQESNQKELVDGERREEFKERKETDDKSRVEGGDNGTNVTVREPWSRDKKEEGWMEEYSKKELEKMAGEENTDTFLKDEDTCRVRCTALFSDSPPARKGGRWSERESVGDWRQEEVEIVETCCSAFTSPSTGKTIPETSPSPTRHSPNPTPLPAPLAAMATSLAWPEGGGARVVEGEAGGERAQLASPAQSVEGKERGWEPGCTVDSLEGVLVGRNRQDEEEDRKEGRQLVEKEGGEEYDKEKEEDEFGMFVQAEEEPAWVEGLAASVAAVPSGRQESADKPVHWTSEWTDSLSHQSEDTWTAFSHDPLEEGQNTAGRWWQVNAAEKGTDQPSASETLSSVFSTTFPLCPAPVFNNNVPTLTQLLQVDRAQNQDSTRTSPDNRLLDGFHDLNKMIGQRYKRANGVSRDLLLQSLHLNHVYTDSLPGPRPVNNSYSPGLRLANQHTPAGKRRLSYDQNRNIMEEQ